MRNFALIGAVLALIATPAFAKDAPTGAASNASQSTSKAERVLYICDGSAMTRRGFAREYGSADYVTAREALQKGEAWAAPKCISPAEARRLKQQRRHQPELASAR